MTPPEDKAPPKDNVMTECRIAFEKMFSHLDLGSIGGKNYTSKRTNNHWRGFQAAWNIRDVAPDPTPIQSPDQGAVLDAVERVARLIDNEAAIEGEVFVGAFKDLQSIRQALTRPPLDLAGLKDGIIKLYDERQGYDAQVVLGCERNAIRFALDHLQAIRPDLFGK